MQHQDGVRPPLPESPITAESEDASPSGLLDRAEQQLRDVENRPPAEQVAVFDAVHRALTSSLSSSTDTAGRPAGDRAG